MSVLFLIAGLAAVVGALCAVTRANPIYASLWTLVALAGVAVDFALLHAPFLAAMQIILYAGAIMVLFVFVIMLLSLKPEEHGEEPPLATKAGAGLVALGIFAFLAYGALSFPGHREWTFQDSDAALASSVAGGVEFGSTEHFGRFLYGNSVVPFELVSVLVTVAVAAVVMLARKKMALGLESDAAPVHALRGVATEGPSPPRPQAMDASDLRKTPTTPGSPRPFDTVGAGAPEGRHA